jgi:DNA-binding PadR family transcriptional regulator
MTRLFKRGELQAAVLDALAAAGPANGYAIMQALADRIGEGWQPSPGAVYPALLGLQDAGLIDVTERDGNRDYQLSVKGRSAATKAAGTLETVAARAKLAPRSTTLGALIDAHAIRAEGRSRQLTDHQQRIVLHELDQAHSRIDEMLNKEM